ncbi:MAG: Holliday junction resolvase RuvX [Oscillospiraceae bacterium]|jgi:putative Holliday junction resolvase|nr:Holliday junction resolvase RuvX [Oscillospiraceae bacterium]
MRIMAVDYGDARTGVAVSDMTGTLAGEAFVIEERDIAKLAVRIGEHAQERDVATIVLGNPKNMDGTLGERAEKSAALAELLRTLGLAVALWDERRTTIDAHRILSEHNVRGKKRKSTVDAVAATLILEGYLASLKP